MGYVILILLMAVGAGWWWSWDQRTGAARERAKWAKWLRDNGWN